MKNACIFAVALSIASMSGALFAGPPPVVNPEQMDMGADITAKIGKEKSKKSSMAHSMKSGNGSGSGGSADCGVVNINSNDKKNNSGIKDMFGKQSTTIVTGPVINMANCK